MSTPDVDENMGSWRQYFLVVAYAVVDTETGIEAGQPWSLLPTDPIVVLLGAVDKYVQGHIL